LGDIPAHGRTQRSVTMQLVSWDEAFSEREAGDGLLVELAVGNGRVAIPVAQETERCVIGIDTSPAMLAQARERGTAAGGDLDLREGDMRDLALEAPASLIYCPARALTHLPSWADRRRAFERVAESLKEGGRFARNAFAFDHHNCCES